MNDAVLAELSAWLTQAGLSGSSEIEIVSGFCERCVAAGLPVARALMFVDTLHPVYEGRLLRWGYGPTELPLLEYGRTSVDALAASGSNPKDVQAAERWRESPPLQDAANRRLVSATPPGRHDQGRVSGVVGFPGRGDDGLCRDHQPLCPRRVIGEMDGVYLSWATRAPDGFSNDQIAALEQLAHIWRSPSNRCRSRA